MIKSLRFKKCDQECYIDMFRNRVFPLTLLLNCYATEYVNANEDYNNAVSKDDILFRRNCVLIKETNATGC
jgi:hypothetical protein